MRRAGRSRRCRRSAAPAASACVATAATAPVRSAVTERASSSASGSDVRVETHHAHDRRQPGRRVAGEGRDPLEHRQLAAAGGHRAEVAVGRAVEVDLRRHDPLAAVVGEERRARALDRLGRRHRGEHRVVVQDQHLRHGGGDDSLAAVPNRRPQPRDRRPRRLAREAAAIVAALERFMRDTAPTPAPVRARRNPWLRAALLEQTGREPDEPTPWGDGNPGASAGAPASGSPVDRPPRPPSSR